MKQARILIVEDDSSIGNIFEKTLYSLGYQVIGTTASGEDAVKIAEEERPDLILMDIMLEGRMDGIEAGQVIFHSLNIPVVFVTAFMDENFLEQAKKSHMLFGYLIKPVSKFQLRSQIEILLHQHKLETEKIYEKRGEEILQANNAIIAVDDVGEIRFVNEAAENLLGENAEGKNLFSHQGLQKTHSYCIILNQFNSGKIMIGSVSPIADKDGSLQGSVLMFKETEMVLRDSEKIDDIVLDEMKNKDEMLTLCSVCKKVKNQKYCWENIEHFLGMSKIQISHGFCPTCMDKLFAEREKKKKELEG